MQRRAKTTTTGGTTTSGVFDGDMYRQTSPVSRTLYYVRDPGGRLLALTDGGTVYYYGLDGHGSVATLTDSEPGCLLCIAVSDETASHTYVRKTAIRDATNYEGALFRNILVRCAGTGSGRRRRSSSAL